MDDGTGGALLGVVDEWCVGGGWVAEQPCGDVVGVVRGLAVELGSSDADADAGEVELADQRADGLHAILPGVGAGGSNADASRREVEFVNEEDQLGWIGAVVVEQCLDGFAGLVHEGAWQGDGDVAVWGRVLGEAVVSGAGWLRQGEESGDVLCGAQSGVMSMLSVVWARVAESDDESAVGERMAAASEVEWGHGG